MAGLMLCHFEKYGLPQGFGNGMSLATRRCPMATKYVVRLTAKESQIRHSWRFN